MFFGETFVIYQRNDVFDFEGFRLIFPLVVKREFRAVLYELPTQNM